jgi:16S rRNA processing protein RimM
VGRLGRPHGLDGFLGVYVEPSEAVYFEPGSVVYVEDRPLTVRAFRQGKKGPQVAFAGIDDRAGAEQIRGSEVFVVERRQLTEGEYWPDDLVGLEVRPGGGRVVAVTLGAAQDRLVVERGDARFEVPFVDELVPVVDLDRGYVEILEIEGLNSPSDRS